MADDLGDFFAKKDKRKKKKAQITSANLIEQVSRIHTTYAPHTHHKRTTYAPHTHHIHTTYTPHTHHMDAFKPGWWFCPTAKMGNYLIFTISSLIITQWS